MSKNKFPKSVSFNVTNGEDVRILKHVEHINFSGYVKQLILADMQKQEQALKIVKKSEGGGIKIVVGR